MFLIICICVIINIIYGEYQCFSDDELGKLYYVNEPDREININDLNPIRLIQGFYGSQTAMQYVGYIYLKEKLGVNVKWYPLSDPNVLYKLYYNDTLYPSYPWFYFEWILDDKYDILFDIWDTIDSRVDAITNYYLPGYVLDGGFIDVWAIYGWFAPSYLYKEKPEYIMYKHMINNNKIRQDYINAYIYNSTTNWLNYTLYSGINNYSKYIFDTPTFNKPLVFGSWDTYGTSMESYRLAKNLFNNTWDFVTLQSEGMLSNLVRDLYKKKLPFIASIYSPHVDFATILNESTGEIMEFENVLIPRNPTNTKEDNCYTSGLCLAPLTPVRKIGNPNLKKRFPEMISFLRKFQLTSNDVNKIMGIQLELSSNPIEETLNFNDHDLWIYSACQFLKNPKNNKTISKYFVTINRYYCNGKISINPCIDYKNNTLELILFITFGVIGLLILIFIMYKMTLFCKDFQQKWAPNSNDTECDKLIKKEKRRIFVLILSYFMTFFIGIIDIITDIISLLSLLFLYKNIYSKLYKIIYLLFVIITLFIAGISNINLLLNIIKSYKEYISEINIQNKRASEMALMPSQNVDLSNFDELNKNKQKKVKTVEISNLNKQKIDLNKQLKIHLFILLIIFIQDIPFLILNTFGLYKYSKILFNQYLFLSMLLNSLSFGYKMRILKEFYAKTQTKNALNDSIRNLKNLHT